ncbi:sugar ABC transporter ATPase [Brachybacterium phenoliresistens]|uniref:Sugar ABC transporter ATPase n=1 Tax=Brachybacterium phenoliresistens TaxID=396014 RepID=Z9JX89_9MICO|nr:sugar ABC transporter ATPase [Brachybacterium phenoliresistens]
MSSVSRTDAPLRAKTVRGDLTDPSPPRTGPAAAPAPVRRRPGFWQRLWRDRILVLFALPGFLVLAIYHYLPVLGNVIAFQDYRPYRGIRDSAWVGLENFRVITEGDPAFLNALANTLILTGLQAVLVFPAPIVLALLLNSLLSERIKRLVQSILYLPHFLSWVVVVALFQQLLGGSGLLNSFLRSHGWDALSIVGNPELFRPLLLAQVLWKDTGWATIIFLAALSAISADLYEAAAVDGAGRWRQLVHVTLPGMKSVIILLFILQLGTSLTVGFEQILLQQNAVGLARSEVLDTYVYNRGVIGGDWGMATAVGLVKSVVGVVLVLGANKLAHMFGEAGVYAAREK